MDKMSRNMDKMSRVDFSRMYTVEHKVKVFDLRTVHPSHLGRIQSQWIKVIRDGGGFQILVGLPDPTPILCSG